MKNYFFKVETKEEVQQKKKKNVNLRRDYMNYFISLNKTNVRQKKL